MPTEDKRIYDEHAVKYFGQLGWNAFAIGKTGRYIDVLALKGSDLAIIEVKSPRETSAVKAYDDSKNLSDALEDEIGDYLQNTRLKVFSLFPQRGQPIVKLYAVAIACQVFRYFHEFEEKTALYEQASGGAVKLVGRKFKKRPFLVVPIEFADELSRAGQTLQKAGYIFSFKTESDEYLSVASFGYPS